MTPTENGGEPQHTSNIASEDVAANRVAKEFTRLYYHILNENPEYLHQFYGPESSVTVSETQDDGANLTIKADTLEHIKGITVMMFADVRVTLTNCTPQSSLGDSVQLMVSGVMHQKQSEDERLFTQALLLAKQDQGYFILNDTVHVHSKHSSWKVLSYQPESGTESTKEVTKEVPTPPTLEPEIKQTTAEVEETEQEIGEDLNNPPPVSTVSEPEVVTISEAPAAAATAPAEVTHPVTMVKKTLSTSAPNQGRNSEDERVGPPTSQNVAPIEKPMPPPPPPVAHPSRPRLYVDVLKAAGR